MPAIVLGVILSELWDTKLLSMNSDNLTTTEMFSQIMIRLDQIKDGLNRLSRRRECFDGDTLLDNYDMCQLLNITKRTLARYRQKKLINYYMIDRKVFYRASEVQEFMKKRER